MLGLCRWRVKRRAGAWGSRPGPHTRMACACSYDGAVARQAAMGDGMGALDGVRVLDLSMFVQGPQAGQLLADLGADVIKVELPGTGDFARGLVLSERDRRSAMFYALNRGKRSITLDLRTEPGKTALRRLAGTVDVLLSNFKPGTLDGWGLGYGEIAALTRG